MKDSVLDIFESSGDANIGQTLLRLAGLAQAAHQYQAALRPKDLARKEQREAEGLGLKSVVTPSRTEAGSVHTEVDR